MTWNLGLLVVVPLLTMGCFLSACDKNDDHAGVGPSIDVHCAGLTPKQFAAVPNRNGDTSTRVNCQPVDP